jgi:hypothetical protein
MDRERTPILTAFSFQSRERREEEKIASSIIE